MNNLNHFPLLRLLIPLIIGILLGVNFSTNVVSSLVTFGVLFLFYFSFLLIKKLNYSYKWRWVFGVVIYLIFVNLGYTLTKLKNQEVNRDLSKLNEQILIGEITEPPIIKDQIVKCILSINGTKNNNEWKSVNGKSLVFLQKNSESIQLHVGDIISFQPEFKDIPEPKNPNEFDYRKYLSFHLITQQTFLKSTNWKVLEKTENNSVFAIADNIRRKMISTLEQLGLTDNELGVASALILGYKNNIEAQLKSSYSNAGAMHVLAVSGLHVGIIFMIFSSLLKFLNNIKFGPTIKGILLLLILWLYALITGFSPSVIRSATMFSFVILAKMLERNSNIFNTLSASAFFMLVWNPLLIYDVGFQLSYAAVTGIVIIQPWLNNLYTPNNKVTKYLWDLFAVSIAAQLATFPLGLYYFHQFPNYFLISNFVVIPLAFVILCIGLASLMLSWAPLISSVLGLGLKYVIWGLNSAISFIDHLPFSVTQHIKFSLFQVIEIYLILIFILVLFSSRKFTYFLISSLLVLWFIFNIIFEQFSIQSQRKLIIYDIPKHTAINFIDQDDNVLIADRMLQKNSLTFHLQNSWIENRLKKEKVVYLENLKKENFLSTIYKIDNRNLFTKRTFFQFYNYKIAIIDNNVHPFVPSKKIEVDELIWTQNCKVQLKNIIKMYAFSHLIIDSSNSTYTNNKLLEEAKNLGIKVWSVANYGAYYKDLSIKNF